VTSTFVVPIGGSTKAEPVLFVARSLAAWLNARVVLMSSGRVAQRPRMLGRLDQLTAESPTIATETRFVANATPADAILSVARETEDAVVCMATHARGRLRWAAMGRIAEDVICRATTPILLVGPHCATGWPTTLEHLVVCVDDSTVADPILPTAVRWARALDLEVSVVHAVHPLDTDGAKRPDKYLEAICARFAVAGLHAQPTVLHQSASVSDAVADYAASFPAALIAMTSHARHGVSRVTQGSIAMRTVAHATCPVLITAAQPERK
jgi:nucleotide-binding universal stress UspA family protein